MMRLIGLVLITVLLSGCSAITQWIPSGWDANQSARITDIQVAIASVNCSRPQATQVAVIDSHVTWLITYSTSRGATHQDVIRLITPMQSTVSEWLTRAGTTEPSRVYCELKQTLLQQQALRAARAIQGRW